jgi:hypothetical protein
VGQTVEPRVVRNEADKSFIGLIDNATFCNPEEANLEIVEALTLRFRKEGIERGAIGGGETALLFLFGHSGEAVVGRVAQNDEDSLIALHAVGIVAFLLELGK